MAVERSRVFLDFGFLFFQVSDFRDPCRVRVDILSSGP